VEIVAIIALVSLNIAINPCVPIFPRLVLIIAIMPEIVYIEISMETMSKNVIVWKPVARHIVSADMIALEMIAGYNIMNIWPILTQEKHYVTVYM
jgi:hypothetical protein